MKTRLVVLQREYPEVSPEKNCFKLSESPFYYMLSDEQRTKMSVQLNSTQIEMLKHKYSVLKLHAADIIELCKKSDGQIPLSEEMWKNQSLLLVKLLDIESTRPFTNSNNSDNLEDAVREFHIEFQDVVKSIISEIDIKTRTMLKKFWRSICHE